MPPLGAACRLLFLSAPLLFGGATNNDPPPAPTLAPAGPYHVAHNRIVDSRGREFLIRGTQMPAVTLNKSDLTGEGIQFGPFSPSSYVTLRHRMNMNAIRVPLDMRMYRERSEYRARVKTITGQANRFELLVIFAPTAALPQPDAAAFWSQCAADFKAAPDVFFAISAIPTQHDWTLWTESTQRLVDAIRTAGATQPIVAATFDDENMLQGFTPQSALADPNIIYEFTPHYAATRTNEERSARFGFLSETYPLLATGFDPQLDHASTECAAFPTDPADATTLLEDNLDYFDAHHISWTLSSFVPGRMVTEYRFYNWSKLDDGWVCGESPSKSGIAMVLQAHLWNRNPHGLFPVNPTTGSFILPRGGISTAYGPILADRDITVHAQPLPTKLGNVSVRITDSRGVTRLSPLLYTGGGWSLITFVVPAATAVGPAEVAIVRTDGSRSTGKVVIADYAPGFWTASQDGRGAPAGNAVQRFPDSKTREFPLSDCSTYGCRPTVIPLSPHVTTTLHLEGSGFRYAGPHADIRATVGGLRVPVIAVTRSEFPGHDSVTIELPPSLKGRGETDVVVSVNGVFSNVVRVNCGSL